MKTEIEKSAERLREVMQPSWRAWHYILDVWETELREGMPIDGSSLAETVQQAFNQYCEETT